MVIDKWGNQVLPNGTRIKGELFDDESVQKILRPVLHLFIDRVKYPRTYHLPWSGTVLEDEKRIDINLFRGKEIVVTQKMDGENTTMARDYIHARSVTSSDHISRHWIKNFHANIAHNIPDGWRICGENLYAKHSIHYKHLSSYFQVFSIWDGLTCLDWNSTYEFCQILDLETVPLLWRGKFYDLAYETLWNDLQSQKDPVEGYVVRLAEAFHYRNFRSSVAKFVRRNHVQTHNHWMQSMTVNTLDSL